MDATPSFGVTMISEVPSNPQLTLGYITLSNYSSSAIPNNRVVWNKRVGYYIKIYFLFNKNIFLHGY